MASTRPDFYHPPDNKLALLYMLLCNDRSIPMRRNLTSSRDTAVLGGKGPNTG